MSRTPHFGIFNDDEVLTVEAFAARIHKDVRTAERILQKLEVPVQNLARGVSMFAVLNLKLAIQRGGHERWEHPDEAAE